MGRRGDGCSFHHPSCTELEMMEIIWKGGYKPVRFVSVMLNLLMLADISALAVSGIMISGFVFGWLPVSGGMILSRRLHLFASHWGLAVAVALPGIFDFVRQNMPDYLF